MLRMTVPVSHAASWAPFSNRPANGAVATSSETNPMMSDSPLRNPLAKALVR